MRKSTLYYTAGAAIASLMLLGAGCQVETTGLDGVTTTTNTVVSDDAAMVEDSLWTSATDAGDITGSEMTGTLNSEDFTVAYVQVDYNPEFDETYNWSFSDQALDDVCGFTTDDNEVLFSSKDLQVGTFAKTVDEEVPFDDYYSYYKYMQPDGVPYSVNTDWATTIVVTDLEQGVSEGPFGESVGSISGFASFEFSDGKTVVSGPFEAELCETLPTEE